MNRRRSKRPDRSRVRSLMRQYFPYLVFPATLLDARAILQRVFILRWFCFVLGRALGLYLSGFKNTVRTQPSISKSLRAALERIGKRLDAAINNLQLEGILVQHKRHIFSIPNNRTVLDISTHPKAPALSLAAH